MERQLTKEMIDKCFEQAQIPPDYIISLYKLVIDNFQHIKNVNTFPHISLRTYEYIWKKSIQFDRKWKKKENDTSYIPGGVWIKYGFTEDSKMQDWMVKIDKRKIKWRK